MRLALTLLLLLLVSCAESPSRPTTSGGSSSGSGKVVTATPEEPYECDSDLILEPHLPEECIPPEPPEPVVQKPVEPPKPDPIVGTYRVFYTFTSDRQEILRVYPNNRVSFMSGLDTFKWRKERDVYHFYRDRVTSSPAGPQYDGTKPISEQFVFSSEYIDSSGEPHLRTFGSTTHLSARWFKFEAVKLSDSPNHLFDHFRLTKNQGSGEWGCENVGRQPQSGAQLPLRDSWTHSQTDFAYSLVECEALCPTAVQSWSPDATCPQDRQ